MTRNISKQSGESTLSCSPQEEQEGYGGKDLQKYEKNWGESNFSSGNGQPREPRLCHQLYRRTFVSCAAISYRPEVRSPCDSWERIASSKASRCAPERNRTKKNKTDRWWIGRSAASAHISASRTRVTPRNASRTGLLLDRAVGSVMARSSTNTRNYSTLPSDGAGSALPRLPNFLP